MTEGTISAQDVAMAAVCDADNCDIVRDGSGQIHRYDKVKWVQISLNKARTMMFKYDVAEKSTVRKRNEALEYVFCLDRHIEQIEWNSIRHTEIPFRDCIWDAATGTTRPHRREDWLDAIIPHNAATPHASLGVMDLLAQWWGHEPDYMDRVRGLAQFMGYCLMAHNRYKRALMLIGPRDTGKSVLLHVFEELVGHDAICCVPLGHLSDPRKLAPIKGKRINLLPDLDAADNLADGGFKAITGGDPVQLDPKNQQPYRYTPGAKFVVACNTAPRVDDKSDAVFERFMVFEFSRQFSATEKDPNLMDKIKANMGDWVAFAMTGAKDLVACNGSWCIPQSSKQFVQTYAAEENQLYWWYMTRCKRTGLESDFVSTAEITEDFNAHEGKGRWSSRAVGKAFAALARIPDFGIKQCRRNDGNGWTGFRIAAYDERVRN